MIARALLRVNNPSFRQASPSLLARHVGVTSSFTSSAFLESSSRTSKRNDPKTFITPLTSSWNGSTSSNISRSSIRLFSAEAPTSNHAHTKLVDAKGSLIYTETDEAPALATFSLLPSLSKFGAVVDVDVVPCDISVSGRVLATFPEKLKESQRVPDNLAYLGEICKTPEACVVKLPNVSASIPQLKECIAELREKGYDVPLYPDEPKDADEVSIQARYSTVLGSAVNPVLREGNSDRRVAAPVKEYAQRNPHKLGIWSKACRTHVAHMTKGDFYDNEKSCFMPVATSVAIELVNADDGSVNVLKDSVQLQEGELIDASFMNVEELCKFFEREITEAKESDLLLSLHLKATMMKISDPIMFGHCVQVYFKDAFEKHGKLLEEIGANPNNGLGAVLDSIEKKLPAEEAKQVKKDFEACYEDRPWLAMVNSDKGITNLHVPSDVIIDASMPNVIRDSGQMWNKLDELEDTKCLIPDRCYATMYQEVISFVKTKGQFDVSTMGNVANVGLMAQKAEEYGSHPQTFEMPNHGIVRVRDKNTNKVYMEHMVNKGDIWRMCQSKPEPIRDWVKLAVNRARATGSRAIFWLDPARAHDANLIVSVNHYLKEHDLSGLDIGIMKPVDAVRVSMERAIIGLDTISVTGNVLRDYLTDLFPIIELGTSAKMLSIVPLLNGGCLYETGAGGSAPKHVQQFVEVGHLRWDSLGEYLATAEALQNLGITSNNEKCTMLGDCLNKAVGKLLKNRKSPTRRVNEIDNRGTNFYVTLYWAEYLSEADPDTFKPVYDKLSESRTQIVSEFTGCQGDAVDLGGYYLFDADKANKAMNPSPTLTSILDSI